MDLFNFEFANSYYNDCYQIHFKLHLQAHFTNQVKTQNCQHDFAWIELFNINWTIPS